LASGSPNKAPNLTIRTEFISLEQLNNEESPNQLPDQVAVTAAVEEARTHLPATQGSQFLPNAAGALLTASESTGLADVIDCVAKILNLGDVVAEVGRPHLLSSLILLTQRHFQVHPYAKAAWVVLSLIPKVWQARRSNSFC
jgi:hypothetical protein